MEMESHEEKLHNMIKLSKMESAKDQAQAAAKAIKDRQKEMQRMGLSSSGISSSSYSEDRETPSTFTSPSAPSSSVAPASPLPSAPSTSKAPVAVKGMSLGAMGKSKAFEDALIKEDKITPIIPALGKGGSVESSSAAAPQVVQVQHPIMLAAVEKVSARLSRDGLVESLEIKGSLSLTAISDDVANCIIKLKNGAKQNSSFSFTTHPKVNKAVYDKNGVLQLKDKDTSKGFPSGRPVGILKWTNSSTDEDLLPLKINCWPEEEARGQMNVSIEYSMDLSGQELHDVRICIPLGTSSSPNILSIDGSYRLNSANSELVWELAIIDSSNSSGSLEFSIQQRDTNAFFPISVHFSSKQLYCPIDITEVTTAVNDSPVMFGYSKAMSSAEFIIA
jgi:coatomer subunit delta